MFQTEKMQIKGNILQAFSYLPLQNYSSNTYLLWRLEPSDRLWQMQSISKNMKKGL